jgi:hypothetical protein
MAEDLLTTGGQLPAPRKITAVDICNWMAETFSEANGYACLFEVSNGTGSHARRSADAVVMNLWPSRGLELVGYEHKVSRSDWLHELKQPEKAWPVMQYCDRWILLAAPGVAKAEEIPINWGWHEFDGEKLKVRKAAPALQPKTLDRTFLGAMLRRPVRDVENMVKRAVEKRRAELEEDFERRVEQRANARLTRAEEVMKKVAEIKEATGIDLTGWTASTEKVTAALKFAIAAEPFSRFGGVSGAVQDVERALERLQELRTQLAEFIPAEPEHMAARRKKVRGGATVEA